MAPQPTALPTILVLLFASLSTSSACAWQGQAVRATLQGRTLRYSRVSGEYCEHCAGKQTVFVQAEGEDVITLSLAFDFNDCNVLRKARIGTDGRAELVYGQLDDANDRGNRAVNGEIVCHVAEPERVDISFWGVLPNGKRIEGSLSTELKFDSGYD
jgi:hypothetical protein